MTETSMTETVMTETVMTETVMNDRTLTLAGTRRGARELLAQGSGRTEIPRQRISRLVQVLVMAILGGALPNHACSEGSKGRPPGECADHESLPAPPNASAAKGLWLVEAGRAAHSRSVVELLDHPVASVRARAALAAGRLGTEELGRAVQERLGDESPVVRRAACEALALADHRGAEEPLLFRLATDPEQEVQIAALRALGLVGGTPAVKALLTLARDLSTPTDRRPNAEVVLWRALRREALLSLALLARRGASAVRPALFLATEILGRGRSPSGGASDGSSATSGDASGMDNAEDVAPVEDRRVAAYLLATMVDRFSWAGRRIPAQARRALAREALTTQDPELRDSLGRATVKLGLHGPASLAVLVRRAGQVGRMAAEAIVESDAPKGLEVQSLVERLIGELPETACRKPGSVMLWELLGHLAGRPALPWLARVVGSWVGGLRDLQKKAEAGSCAAVQMARLTCRAALVADRVGRRLQHTIDCGSGLLGEDEVLAFVVEALGSQHFGDRAMPEIARRYASGGPRTRAAALEAAGRLKGSQAERLIQIGLGSSEASTFAAAAEACGALLGATPAEAMVGVGVGAGRECAATCRKLLLAQPAPPGVGEVIRWIDLVKHVRGLGDDALVRRLGLAARHHNPTLRAHALVALSSALAAKPAWVPWESDPRPPPAEPLEGDVTLALETAAGRITLRLRHDWAPISVAHLAALAEAGALVGSTFHRVVPGFVTQGGDPTLTGHGGDTGLLLSEWSGVRFRRGVVGLAHAGKDTEGSQFFILLGPAPHLDFRYTAVGEITAGLELAEVVLPGDSLSVRVMSPLPRKARPRVPPAEGPSPGESAPGEAARPGATSREAAPGVAAPREAIPREATSREAAPGVLSPREAGRREAAPREPARQGRGPRGTPRGQAPRGQAPRAQAPRGQAPRGQAPRGQAPRGQAPRGQTPRAQPGAEPAPGEGTIRLSPEGGGGR